MIYIKNIFSDSDLVFDLTLIQTSCHLSKIPLKLVIFLGICSVQFTQAITYTEIKLKVQ